MLLKKRFILLILLLCFVVLLSNCKLRKMIYTVSSANKNLAVFVDGAQTQGVINNDTAHKIAKVISKIDKGVVKVNDLLDNHKGGKADILPIIDDCIKDVKDLQADGTLGISNPDSKASFDLLINTLVRALEIAKGAI